MKVDLALRDLHRAEKSLLRDLLAVADRHVEYEVHYVARDLTGWSRAHVHRIAEARQRYGLNLEAVPPETPAIRRPCAN